MELACCRTAKRLRARLFDKHVHYLDTVDVKNTLRRGDELEVDDMRQRPHSIVSHQGFDQLGFDCGDDHTRIALHICTATRLMIDAWYWHMQVAYVTYP